MLLTMKIIMMLKKKRGGKAATTEKMVLLPGSQVYQGMAEVVTGRYAK